MEAKEQAKEEHSLGVKSGFALPEWWNVYG